MFVDRTFLEECLRVAKFAVDMCRCEDASCTNIALSNKIYEMLRVWPVQSRCNPTPGVDIVREGTGVDRSGQAEGA